MRLSSAFSLVATALALAFNLHLAAQASQDETLDFLTRLTQANGTPGEEGSVVTILREKVQAFTELSRDSRGALIAKKRGTSDRPRILLAAHMDEVGFQVKSITSGGFLRVVPLGSWFPAVMLGQRVVVRTAQGDLPGVFGATPPHVLTSEQRQKAVQLEDMYVDIGAKDESHARKLGVEPGDHIVPEGAFTRMADPNMLLAKAWDDRVGCAVIAEVLERLQQTPHPNTVYGAWTPLEEVGRLNATVEMENLRPDLVIVVEVGITVDTPGVSSEMVQERIGHGPSLDLYDGVLITPPNLKRWVVAEAGAAGIPLQFTTLGSGGGSAHGVSFLFRAPSIALLVPLRYAHTPNSLLDYRDYTKTKDLLFHLISTLDQEKWRRIVGE
ncbi:MAG TPA: peptidase M28 [Acidobacteriota bacterium]|nr:peptidase M28 [Acidobacteriota bacterium]